MGKNEEQTYSEYRLIDNDDKEIARSTFDKREDITAWIITEGEGKKWILQGLDHDRWVTLERSGRTRSA